MNVAIEPVPPPAPKSEKSRKAKSEAVPSVLKPTCSKRVADEPLQPPISLKKARACKTSVSQPLNVMGSQLPPLPLLPKIDEFGNRFIVLYFLIV